MSEGKVLSVPSENDIPDGFRVLLDDEIVKPGDTVLDCLWACGYAEVRHFGRYDHLIGLTANEARLNRLCFEMFTKL